MPLSDFWSLLALDCFKWTGVGSWIVQQGHRAIAPTDHTPLIYPLLERYVVRRLGDRLSEATSRAIVGRKQLVDTLVAAITAPEPEFAVAFVHGIGGIGKSSLLRALFVALPDDCERVRLDCREIEPTPQGLLAAIASQVAAQDIALDVESLADHIAQRSNRMVFAFDTYETFGLLDSWLRQSLLPALPALVTTIIASREPPSPGWVTDAGWASMFREFPLGPLNAAESLEMLRARGLSEDSARRINRFARGHPLALELAAAGARARPEVEIEADAMPRVVELLTDTFLSGLDAELLAALEASSVVRRVTKPLLAALVQSPASGKSFERMRGLSFVSPLSEGLALHDLVRDAVAIRLVQSDPARHAAYRRNAWTHLNAEARGASNQKLWQLTADLLYLVQNPNVRNAFFRPSAIEVSIDSAQASDRHAIEQICCKNENADSTEWLLRWFDRHPDSFFVGRTRIDRVAGFYCIFLRDAADPALLRADPVTAAWCSHLDADPVLPSERVLFCRRWLSREHGEAPGPIQAAFWVDIKRLYFELRPHLRRIYCPVIDPQAYAALIAPLGFRPIAGGQVRIGDVDYYSAMLDFGPDSIDGWLSHLVGVELATHEGEPCTRAGLRTVLFTDMVGHTEMMQRLGDARGREVLRYHESVTRKMLHRYGGDEIKTLGDGFMASFASVSAAIDCAIMLQRVFSSPDPKGETESISVRIGLNAGEPIEDSGDLYGASVILASRVAAKAKAGEILIPEPVRHLLTGKRFSFADRGEHALKGFDPAVHLYEVRWHA
jgi:class 3 adenylate cyclase